MAIPQVEILVSKDNSEVIRKIFPPGEYIIGRDKGADISIEDVQLSPRHARLKIDDDAIFIEDLQSDAGTYVNGRPIKDNTRVWPSQKIRLANVTVEGHRIEAAAGAVATEGDTVPSEVVVEHTYEIEKVLMRDEEGPVLDTHDSAIRRDLAMKVMHPGATEEEVARFIEEAQITGQLEHPGIPPIYELGTDEKGRPYYTMKLVRGITLKKILELLHDRQTEALAKYSLRTLLSILRKACDAVAFAHSKGVIHRNLKPESINVGDCGEVLVMDWSKAILLDANGAAASSPHNMPACPSEASPTCPQYLAPEQARGEISTLDTRTDIYGLGAILYHILTLRAPINDDDPVVAMKLVADGLTDHLDVGQRYPHLPRERVPDPLAAIVTKAMALQPSARYQRVESLEADLDAYQNATLTEAEKVGPLRQFLFVVNRYKTVSTAAAIVVGASVFFGVTGVLSALHYQKQAAADRAMATNLRSKAAEFLKLAEHQADTQRFADALTSVDAAIAVDPAPPRPYWERAWALLALERWDEAIAALQAAQQRGPGANPDRVVAAAQKMKAVAKDPQRWKNESAHEIFRYLDSAGATGPAFAIATKLQENAEARRKLVEQKLLGALGKDRFSVTSDSAGLVAVSVAGQPLRSLDALRSLPIDSLDASGTAVTDLEPLRGLRLQSLNLANTKVITLTPLTGMPLRKLVMDNTPAVDLQALKGLPLETVSLEGCTKVYDFTVVKSWPVRTLNLKNTVVTNLNVLQGVALDSLNLSGTYVNNLAPLQGGPLKTLNLRNCKKLVDFRPVLSLTQLERFSCDVLPKELVPLRQSKTLQIIEADVIPGENYQGARPAANFWADYDAKVK